MDLSFLLQFDLKRAIRFHDMPHVVSLMRKMVIAGRTLPPELMLNLCDCIDPTTKHKEGRKKEHFYFCEPGEMQRNYDIVQEYKKLCVGKGRGVATKLKTSLCKRHGIGVKDFEKQLTAFNKAEAESVRIN